MKLGLLIAAVLPLWGAEPLAILPSQVVLRGPEARQQLLVEAEVSGHQEDWTRTATWRSSDASVAVVDETGVVKPVGDGSARIMAESDGRTASVAVTVEASHAPFTWNFRNDVIPVLTKNGCNQGACLPRGAGWEERL